MSKNLFKLSRRTHGFLSNLLLRPHPSPSSSSIASSIQPHYLPQTLNPFILPNPNSRPSIPIFNSISTLHFPSSLATHLIQSYSSESNSAPKNPNETPNPTENPPPEFKHQEIEGPTVERDLSPLAEESRQVSLNLMKTMYDVSRVLAVLSLSQLALGAWISYAAPSSSAVMSMSVAAFAVPFAMSLMLRRAVKQMKFFDKMEKIGRLQILTSTMQIAKQVNLFFVRVRAVAYLCLAGLPLPIVVSIIMSSNSAS